MPDVTVNCDDPQPVEIDADTYTDCDTFGATFPTTGMHPPYSVEEKFEPCTDFDAAFPLDKYSHEIEYGGVTGSYPGGGSFDCICCECACCPCRGFWTQVSFTIAGVTGGASCLDTNGTWTLIHGDGCSWSLMGGP